MLTHEEEMRIIAKVLDGDTNAFEALVEDQKKVVFNLALRMLGNEEDAYDISQDAFLKAYTNLASFRGDCKFSSWLYKLTTNLCLDFIRKRNRHKVVPLVFEDDNGDSEYMEIPDDTYSPEVCTEQKQLRESVRAGLSKLAPQQREILVLREIGGLRYDEIGRQLNLEEGTVKSRIFRARKKLCEILSKDGNISHHVPSKKLREEGADSK